MLNFIVSLIVVVGFLIVIFLFPMIQSLITWFLMLILFLLVIIAGVNFFFIYRQKKELKRKFPNSDELHKKFDKQLNSKKPKIWND